MTDCIIVGGGLIGMLTARELAQAGVEVAIIEKGALGGESTWAGGGILSPLYPWRYPDSVTALARYSQSVYPDIADQLKQESGIDPEYTRSGLLVLDMDEGVRASSWAQHWGMSLQQMESRQLHECEPRLADNFSQGIFMPDIAQLRNPRLAKALKGSLDHHNITYYENNEVLGLNIQHNAVKGVRTAHGDFSTDKVVIAGGAWSAKIIAEYTQPPVIEPVKGQMIIFRGEPGLLERIILYKDHYVIPRRDGRILAGSTIEHTGFDKQISEQALQDLRNAATELVPALKDLPIEHHWSGLRPGTPSGIPYICEHPRLHGLYINSGHFRNGVVLGAASANLMTSLILKRPIDLPAEAYALDMPH